MNLCESLFNKIELHLNNCVFHTLHQYENQVNEHFYSEIKQAHQYPISNGGKRIRPLLTLLTAGAFGG